MARTCFFNFGLTPELALNLDESPGAELHYLDQIQLLPKDPQPYIQITDGESPMSVANDYEVSLVNCRTSAEEEITDHVQITNLTINGTDQLQIRLAYLPTDHYGDLVYLKIDRGTVTNAQKAPTYYSNPFLVTRMDEELTTRIDYSFPSRNPLIRDSNSIVRSVRLRMYENNKRTATELATYFQITTGQLTNSRTQPRNYIEWLTKPFNSYTLQRLESALYRGRCYFNQVRQYPTERIENNGREASTNISEMKIITDPNPNDTLKIIHVVIGSSMIDFRVNVPNIRINDPDGHLITQTQIPT